MTTIQELISFGSSAAKGDTKSFDGLFCAVAKAEEPQQGEYGQMQRAQIRDGSGSRWFTAMDCAELHGGEQIEASGRVKGGPKGAYYNITSWRSVDGSSGPPSPAGRPLGVSPTFQQPTRTVRQAVGLIKKLCADSESWAIKGEAERQALISTILIAWSKGDLTSAAPAAPAPPPPPPPRPEPQPEPEYAPEPGEDDDDLIPFIWPLWLVGLLPLAGAALA